MLDRGGVEGLSMRRVGEERGTGAASLTGTFETRKSSLQRKQKSGNRVRRLT
jgi:hypothetical protein